MSLFGIKDEHFQKYQYLCIKDWTSMERIPLYKFDGRKYGSPLKVDVINISEMWENIHRTPFYRTTFYSVKLITEGCEQISVNGCQIQIEPGMVVCARPSEIWQWQENSKLEGYHLLWKEDFLLSFFNDPHFIDHFSFLRADRTSPFLKPTPELFQRLLALFRDMQQEIDINKPEKDQHILRAMLYESLMYLNRCPIITTPSIEAKRNDNNTSINDNASRFIDRFQSIAHEHYREQHDVEYYADKLAITSNYLNKITKQSLGITTKRYLQQLLIDEAKRQLYYTTLSVAEISRGLFFETPSYFIRFFSKHTGFTPLEFRKQQK
jgi:AraC-like DNA-binding protein